MTKFLDPTTYSDEDYAEVLGEFVRSEGYQLFCGELYALSENLNNLQDVKDQSDLDFKRGQLAVIGLVLNYQELMEQGS